MGEAQTRYFYDFGISEPVTKPQNQPFLFLETPGYLKQIKKTLAYFQKPYFCKSRDLGNPKVWQVSKKTSTEKRMKIRVKQISKILDMYFISINNMKWKFCNM